MDDYSFIIKDTHRARCGSVLNVDPLSVESACVISLASQCVHQSGISTELQCPEFLLVFHYVKMTD